MISNLVMVSLSLYKLGPAMHRIIVELANRREASLLHTGSGGLAANDCQFHVLNFDANQKKVNLADHYILQVVSAHHHIIINLCILSLA